MHEISNIFTKEKTISSLEVAEMVEKKHYNLIRDIKGYVDELTELKIEFSDFFRESTYKDSTGRTLPRYDITKKAVNLSLINWLELRGQSLQHYILIDSMIWKNS